VRSKKHNKTLERNRHQPPLGVLQSQFSLDVFFLRRGLFEVPVPQLSVVRKKPLKIFPRFGLFAEEELPTASAFSSILSVTHAA
jgi:hypothetical protein